jgi:hypothetical protein
VTESTVMLEEEVLRLYREPIIGASYSNTFGEENIKNLVHMYRELEEEKMRIMRTFLASFSKSSDLATSFVSVGVLHALGMKKELDDVYQWAQGLDDKERFMHHFAIGKSLAEYFT